MRSIPEGAIDDGLMFARPGIVPHRNHEPTADFELFFQRFRNGGAARGNNDAVVGCMLRPSLGPIRMANMHVLIAEVGEPGCGLLGELTDPFYGVDLARNPGQDCGRIARSGPISRILSPPRSASASVMNATMYGCEMVWPSSIGSGKSW